MVAEVWEILVLSNDFSSIQVIGIDSIDKPRASRAQSQARLSYAETPPRLQASWVQIYNISTKQPNDLWFFLLPEMDDF